MNLRRLAAGMGAVALLAGVCVSAEAKSKASLAPFAGSYTGTVESTTGTGTITGSATLTFTGRNNSLRGTFLYTGILNSLGTPRNVVQTLTISKRGALNGRVTVDGIDGLATGQASMRGKKLSVAMVYSVGPFPVTINFTGMIVFKGKHATWTSSVSSSDITYNGSLSFKGKR